MSSSQVLNALTVDVEEHFHVSNFAGVISREAWDVQPSRVEANIDKMLDLFEGASVSATFFVLGWIARRHPRMVRRIADRGHEVASHGDSHRLVFEQGIDRFRAETQDSRQVLQDASGQAVEGYRAASFSITRRSLWALDVLAECGFRYDSSIFPVLHDRYGIPGARRAVHRLTTPSGHSLVEVPPSTIAVGRIVLPVCGGGYLRLYPRWVTEWAIRRLNGREGLPAVVYVHPWELDPDQPRIQGPWLGRFRHYFGLRSTRRKLGRILRGFRFGTMAQVVEASATDRCESLTPRAAGRP